MKTLFISLVLCGLAAQGAEVSKADAAPSAVVEAVAETPNVKTNDAVYAEYRKVLEADEEAQDEIDRWIREAQAFGGKGAGDPRGTLKNRIRQRVEPVDKSYKNFIQLHPDHVAIRLAYGSFLNDTGSENEAVLQWEKARELDPNNPAPYNNLAEIYGRKGSSGKAIEAYEKAISLKPDEALYYRNLANHVYLTLSDSAQYYHLTEEKTFDKAQDLFRRALELAPDNFVCATEYAQSFYGAKPPRLKEGLAAWGAALKLAKTPLERQGVYMHLARVKMALGQTNEALGDLAAVTDSRFDQVKKTILTGSSNAAPASLGTNLTR